MRYFELNNDKNLTDQNLWNIISDQREVYSFKWVHKNWESMIEVSVLGSYKIKGKSNPVNK